jgi:hypothetical protein
MASPAESKPGRDLNALSYPTAPQSPSARKSEFPKLPNSPPDLQQLVEKAGPRRAAQLGEAYDPNNPAHSGHSHITAQEWAEYDRAKADWQERQRRRSEGGPSGEIPLSDRSDPEALCICGLAGVYWRPRKPDKHGKRGHPIWRCEAHRDSWPDYADDVPNGAAYG